MDAPRRESKSGIIAGCLKSLSAKVLEVHGIPVHRHSTWGAVIDPFSGDARHPRKLNRRAEPSRASPAVLPSSTLNAVLTDAPFVPPPIKRKQVCKAHRGIGGHGGESPHLRGSRVYLLDLWRQGAGKVYSRASGRHGGASSHESS